MKNSSEVAARNLQQNLLRCEPHLFNLADQLVEASAGAGWNVVIGDDTSGRLPTYFVRKVLASAGHPLPTWFVTGSKQVRDKIGHEAYSQHFKTMAQHYDLDQLRPLIVTESINTGETLEFLSSILQEQNGTVETASVVCKNSKDEQLVTYCGGAGEAASRDIYYTFESVAENKLATKAITIVRRNLPQFIKNRAPDNVKRIGTWPANALLGIYASPDNSSPVAGRHPDTPTTAMAYHMMQASVERYCDSRAEILAATNAAAAE